MYDGVSIFLIICVGVFVVFEFLKLLHNSFIKNESETDKYEYSDKNEEDEQKKVADEQLQQETEKRIIEEENRILKGELEKQLLIERATIQNIASAQFELALHYFVGDIFPQDFKKARILIQRAAEQDVAEAQFILGQMYEEGFAIRQNIEQAKEMYGKACDNGSMLGCDNYKRLNIMTDEQINININIHKDGILEKIKEFINMKQEK